MSFDPYKNQGGAAAWDPAAAAASKKAADDLFGAQPEDVDASTEPENDKPESRRAEDSLNETDSDSD